MSLYDILRAKQELLAGCDQPMVWLFAGECYALAWRMPDAMLGAVEPTESQGSFPMPDFATTHASDNPHHEKIEKDREAKRAEDQKAIDKVNAEAKAKRDGPSAA